MIKRLLCALLLPCFVGCGGGSGPVAPSKPNTVSTSPAPDSGAASSSGGGSAGTQPVAGTGASGGAQASASPTQLPAPKGLAGEPQERASAPPAPDGVPAQLSRAAAAARAQNFAETLAIVEKVLQEEPENQRGLGLMAEAAQMRALGLIQAQQESEAIPLFFKSAQAIRKLRELNPNLGPTEQRLLPVILYNETCAYCRSAEPDLEKALSSFRDAIDAGFRDVAQIDKDTDLDPIRDQPEFKELRARLEKP